MGTSNFSNRNVQNGSSLNTLINLQQVIHKDSIVTINDERTYQNNFSEEISSHTNPADIIDHECDDSVINLINIEEEVCFTCIHSTNETNDIYNKYDYNISKKYSNPF